MEPAFQVSTADVMFSLQVTDMVPGPQSWLSETFSFQENTLTLRNVWDIHQDRRGNFILSLLSSVSLRFFYYIHPRFVVSNKSNIVEIRMEVSV